MDKFRGNIWIWKNASSEHCTRMKKNTGELSETVQIFPQKYPKIQEIQSKTHMKIIRRVPTRSLLQQTPILDLIWEIKKSPEWSFISFHGEPSPWLKNTLEGLIFAGINFCRFRSFVYS